MPHPSRSGTDSKWEEAFVASKFYETVIARPLISDVRGNMKFRGTE